MSFSRCTRFCVLLYLGKWLKLKKYILSNTELIGCQLLSVSLFVALNELIYAKNQEIKNIFRLWDKKNPPSSSEDLIMEIIFSL